MVQAMGKTLKFCIGILFGFSLVLLNKMPVEAQPGTKPGKTESAHYYMKDGLPDENVTGIVQDKRGFLWLSTRSGFAKFDGYKFTLFENNPFSANSLSNNSIHSIFLDKKERLWIGHEEGLDVFDLATERFILHWYDSANQKNGLNIRVVQFRERKDGMFWICTAQGAYTCCRLAIKKQRPCSADRLRCGF